MWRGGEKSGKKSDYTGPSWRTLGDTGNSLYPKVERAKNEDHTQGFHLLEELEPAGQGKEQSGASRSCSAWARCGQSLFYPTCAAFLCIAQVSLGVIKAIMPNFSSPQSNWGQFLASPGAFWEPKVALLMIFSGQVWLRWHLWSGPCCVAAVGVRLEENNSNFSIFSFILIFKKGNFVSFFSSEAN